MLFWHHIPLGVDFRGGTDASVKFAAAPDVNKIRTDLNRVGLRDARIQSFGRNEVLISLGQTGNEADLDKGKTQIIDALERTSPAAQDPANKDKRDFNNTGVQTIADYLV